MARQIYRKSLLERMSSPDQLDKMIVITSPSFWMALLGGAVIAGAGLVWSVFGHLPIKLEASGIFVSDQMSYTLAADTGGIVASLEVEVGDYVEEGDVLLMLADDATQRGLNDLLDRRNKVEAVTLTSVGDEVTADNRDLINLKTQLGTVDSETAQNRAMLSVYQAELAALIPRISAVQADMEEAREEYYDYIGAHTNSKVELEFSEAQTNYNQQKSILSSAEASYSNARASYQNIVKSAKNVVSGNLDPALAAANQDLNTANTNLEAARATAAAAGLEALKTELEALKAQLNNLDPSDAGYAALETQIADKTNAISALEAPVKTAEAAVSQKQEAVDTLNGMKSTVNGLAPDAAPENFADFLAAGLWESSGHAQLQSQYAQFKTAEDVYNEAAGACSSAEQAYNKAKEAYMAYANGRAENDAEKERLGNLYNQLNNDYSTLHSKKTNLESNITSIEGQLRAANVGSSMQSESYQEQFEAARAAVLSSLDAEIENYRYNLEKTNIRAAVSGSVTDIKVGVGSAVGQGSEIVTLRQLEEEEYILCYIPITSGKKVVPGMEAIVTPTTINKQEYGHMKAEVVAVDDYVTPTSSINAVLGNEMLTQAFVQSGPVVGVTCRLYTDETTASGYWWSSKKGADLIVPEGTMVTVDVVTEEKAPITMLVPYLKEKLTMAVEPGGGNKGEGR